MDSPFGCTWTEEIAGRCAIKRAGTATIEVAVVLGAAIDAGLVTLNEVSDLVRSCSTVVDLANALLMLATTASMETEAVA